jgi:hypothetical protein
MVVMIMTRSDRDTADPSVTASASPSTSALPDPSTSGTQEVSEPPSAEPSKPAGQGDPTPYSQTDQAEQQWAPVVEDFGRGFVATEQASPDQWRKRLRPYVTAAVAKQLRTVDPGRIAEGRYAGSEALEWADDEVTVRVDYREGWSIVLFVLYDGAKWHVRAYDRWEE